MYKIELHAHTKPVSGCGQLSPRELIEAYHEVGYSGIVITNHFIDEYFKKDAEGFLKYYMNAYHECEEEAAKYGMKIYWGAEFRFSAYIQDFLVYGVDESLLRKMIGAFNYSFSDFHKLVNENGGLFVQAHPFRHSTLTIPATDLDGIEIYNMHSGHSSHNPAAKILREEFKIPYATSGSDCHEYCHVGRGGIISEYLPENNSELCELIKSGNYEFIHNYDFNYVEVGKVFKK